MLVLSRKNLESVVIGGADGFHRLLKVTVLGIQGARVKLGFEVDPGVPVHCSEVVETNQRRRPAIACGVRQNRGNERGRLGHCCKGELTC